MSHRGFGKLTMVGTISLLMAALPSPSAAFAPWEPFGGGTDILATPDKHYEFEQSTILYRLDPLFRLTFPGDVLENQVHLAFQEWETASQSQDRRDAPRYSWNRYNGVRGFNDLRTILVHEIGHVIGSQHADAAYFNNNAENIFRPDGMGGYIRVAPNGGEVMNEGNSAGLPNSKPEKGLRPGEYNRILSKDELYFLDYVYGRDLTFEEGSILDTVQITLSVSNVLGTPSLNLGAGVVDTSTQREPGNPDAGRWIGHSTININATPTLPIGVDARMSSWEVTNTTGEAIDAISIRAKGTDNGLAIETSSVGSHRFTNYAPSNAFALYQFESRGHIFDDPLGGTVPNNGTVQVGLRLDVWDWTVSSARGRKLDGSSAPVSTVGILPFSVDDITFGLPPIDPFGLTAAYEAGNRLIGGLRLVNSDTPTTITELLFAPVEGLDLGLDDLSSDTLARLSSLGLVERIEFVPIELDANEEFLFILEGDRADIPQDILDNVRFMLLDYPDMIDRELLVYARSETDEFLVGAFSLINSPLIAGRAPIPEPGTLVLLLAVLPIMLPRRHRKTSLTPVTSISTQTLGE
jgi:hypothetical protein